MHAKRLFPSSGFQKDKNLVFEVGPEIEGLLSLEGLDNDSIENIEKQYSVDEKYEMLIQEVNYSIKKVIFSSSKKEESESKK